MSWGIVKFMIVPTSVKQYLSNARYYLDAANRLPPPTQDAGHILFLLIGWENIIIADTELSAKAQGSEVGKELHKDHAQKFKDAPEVLRVIIGKPGTHTPAKEIRYTSPADFAKLRQICQYGLNGDSKDIGSIFHRGWHADDLRRALANKIGWIEMLIKIYEELDD